MDQNTERLIRDVITANYPDHEITGEEFGATHGGGQYRWIIDPIDGTKSFVTGFPFYGMFLALLKDYEPIFGAIHMPELKETYIGESGKITLNGKVLLKTSQVISLSEASAYTTEGEKIFGSDRALFSRLCKIGAVRRLSYDCFPHALVAAGYIDVCIDYGLKPYDYLPLVPIVEDAGGVITDWVGKPLDMNSDGRVLSSANSALHEALISQLTD